MKTTTPEAQARLVHTNPTQASRTAHAPYNFVPLPERVVTVEPPLALDCYEGHSGYFECELETCSPTYVRGLMTLEDFDKTDKTAKELKPEEKLARAPFYAADPERRVDGHAVPTIPGSSLRGMLRTLVEISGYGKMRWLNETPKITFRTVASSRHDPDPLSGPYRKLLGNSGTLVMAGYLQSMPDGIWQIQPAQRPSERGWRERNAYLKVKDRLPSGAVTGFIRFNDHHYRPGYYPVSFNIANRRGKHGPYVEVTQIGDVNAGYHNQGVLVCSGNMHETAKSGHESPRRNHALVLPPESGAQPLQIDSGMRQDYLDSLTPFQREKLWQPGGLQHDAPVFYVTEDDRVLWFGHTPNFRVPALTADQRAAKPSDFVPEYLRRHEQPDLAEALFGWVEEKDNVQGQHAGRVSVSDASFVEAKHGVWYSESALIPATLGGPKVTTFQHYLVQDRKKKHDPDVRQTLAHYVHNDQETEIRGHKLYWHKGANPPLEASPAEREKESQLTRILPVKPGVRFTFRVHFENLRDYELGALAWALQLPGEAGKTYRHKLGMGKPLGMGAVAITAALHLTERHGCDAGRYASLFSNGRWITGMFPAKTPPFIAAFENFILREKGIAPMKGSLTDVDRVKALLAMLQWREGTTDWLDKTCYQLIEHPTRGDEYKERPVLPDPLAVSGARSTTDDKLGTVKSFPPDRSYGFLIADDVPGDIFVHISQLAKGLQPLQHGQRVRFKTRAGKKGPEAYNVRLAE